MAKQESLIKLRGKLGDLSFYKGRDGGYQARMKGGVDANRIKSDPNFNAPERIWLSLVGQ